MPKRKGYSKNYEDKERLFGFYLWLKNAKLKPTKKNAIALALCKVEVTKSLKTLKAFHGGLIANLPLPNMVAYRRT